MSVTLTESQWESVVVAALTGNNTGLSVILDAVEKTNNLHRYYLWIKWKDLNSPKESSGQIIEWPPTRTAGPFIAYSVFSRDFVESYVNNQTSQSAYVIVTDDHWGEAGWQELDNFFD